MTEGEVKPCPMCGRDPKQMAAMGEYWILCDYCGVSSGMDCTEGGAAARWNTRVSEAPPKEAEPWRLDREAVARIIAQHIMAPGVADKAASEPVFLNAADAILALTPNQPETGA